MTPKVKRLSPREARFVELYLGDGKMVAAEAYRLLTGSRCNTATAKREGHRIITQAHVKAAIEKALLSATVQAVTEDTLEVAKAAKIERDLTASAETIVAELARIGFGRITDVCKIENGNLVIRDTADWPEDIKAAVAEISHGPNGLRVKMHPKEPALIALGKNIGLFKETVEHTGKDGAPLVPVLNVTIGGNQSQPAPEAG